MKDKSEPTPLMVSPTALVPIVSVPAPCDKGDDAGNDAELGCDKSNQKNKVQSIMGHRFSV